MPVRCGIWELKGAGNDKEPAGGSTIMIESGFYNLDCMDGMAQFPDKFFELAIVDPPYGIDWVNRASEPKYARGGPSWEYKSWDKQPPDKSYFEQLKRISKNQIIWGGNYFDLPPTRCYLSWDKIQTFNGSDFELAWTSFDKPCKSFKMCRAQAYGKGVIHPTQKPIALYKWLLSKYAKPGDKILDTHVGSASSLIACHQMGFEYWGFELDTDYYNAATDRLNKAKAQVDIFEAAELPKPEQIGIEEGRK